MDLDDDSEVEHLSDLPNAPTLAGDCPAAHTDYNKNEPFMSVNEIDHVPFVDFHSKRKCYMMPKLLYFYVHVTLEEEVAKVNYV